ncbi:hypothetical protein EL84_16640 [Paenibacillus sp. VT-400]|uniref:hypothetical protein n=1 Tax=Paenibacillus sp. VT-400 TaxID=1495853 RepID=UPI00064ADE9C|nr:hypothetical protein [Paenibacillus sp. VT-400]KLU53864.1 hypothetical protein EL84_16640 [Paenibacillus sp. VT-400]
MKRFFHTCWNNARKTTYITLGLLSCLALFSFWSIANAEEQKTSSLSHASSTEYSPEHHAIQNEKLAPAAVQRFAEQQAVTLGTANGEVHWKNADLDFYPLGPGLHSWLVQAEFEGKPIGYMIITATEQGQLMLSEYGHGEQSPYNNELLGQTLDRQHVNLEVLLAGGGELHLGYALPLLAYWKVEQPNHPALYIDATNGDVLPSEFLNLLEADSKHASASITDLSTTPSLSVDPLHLRPVFNPADNLLWITSKPVAADRAQDVIQHGENQEIVFSAGDRNAVYGGPLPVSGYQLWHADQEAESILYVALGGKSSIQRFVPLSTLQQEGHFYLVNP